MSGHWWWHALAYLVCLCVGMLLNRWLKQRGLYPASKHLRMVALNYNVAPRRFETTRSLRKRVERAMDPRPVRGDWLS